MLWFCIGCKHRSLWTGDILGWNASSLWLLVLCFPRAFKIFILFSFQFLYFKWPLSNTRSRRPAWFEACAVIWNSELGWVFLPAPTSCYTDVPWLDLHTCLFYLNTILLRFQLLLNAISFCNNCQWEVIFHLKTAAECEHLREKWILCH